MRNLASKEGKGLPKVRVAANMHSAFLGITRSPLTCRRRNCQKAPPLGGGIVQRALSLGLMQSSAPAFRMESGKWLDFHRKRDLGDFGEWEGRVGESRSAPPRAPGVGAEELALPSWSLEFEGRESTR